MSEERLATVNMLIAERAVLRKRRQFEKADTMREVLKSRYGVFVVDETMEWAAARSSTNAARKHALQEGGYPHNGPSQADFEA